MKLTLAQIRTIQVVLQEGGKAFPTMGRLHKGCVNLLTVKLLMDLGFLEGCIELDRSKSLIFATTDGVLALKKWEYAQADKANT